MSSFDGAARPSLPIWQDPSQLPAVQFCKHDRQLSLCNVELHLNRAALRGVACAFQLGALS